MPIGQTRGRWSRRRPAFSLIEVLIVVAIIATLVGAAVGVYQNHVGDAQTSRCLSDLDTLAEAVSRYESLEGSPAFELKALLGRYLQTLDPDPWGRPYYIQLGAIYSRGPDNIPGTADDLVKHFHSYPDARTQAWEEARLLARMMKAYLGSLTDSGAFWKFFLDRDQWIPFDPWHRPYGVVSGWVVSLGPTGDSGQPGGAWVWVGQGAAPRGPNGEQLEVPTGLPPEDRLSPIAGSGVSLPPMPETNPAGQQQNPGGGCGSGS